MGGYFEAMRKSHPIKLGELIDGKRVIETFWQWSPDDGNVAMYRLEGDTEAKVVKAE